MSIGLKFFPKASNSYITVKEDHLLNANPFFVDSNENITVEGKRHLGAIVESGNYKRGYFDGLVKAWNSQLCMLSTVLESQAQAAYSTFVNGFKNKLSYFMRTIPNISNLLLPIKDTTRNQFIPAITGGRICNEEEHKLLSLPTRYEESANKIYHKQAEVEYNTSWRITTELKSLITVQQMEYTVDKLAIKKIRNQKQKRDSVHKCHGDNMKILCYLKDNMSEKSEQLLQLSTGKEIYNRFTVLHIAEYGFEMSKQHFWDSISSR